MLTDLGTFLAQKNITVILALGHRGKLSQRCVCDIYAVRYYTRMRYSVYQILMSRGADLRGEIFCRGNRPQWISYV